MVTMGYDGCVSGLEICTVAFDTAQLAITADVSAPGVLERVHQLLNDEPGREILGPFKATDANFRAPPRLAEWDTFCSR
jgi:hypothetical protein